MDQNRTAQERPSTPPPTATDRPHPGAMGERERARQMMEAGQPVKDTSEEETDDQCCEGECEDQETG